MWRYLPTLKVANRSFIVAATVIVLLGLLPLRSGAQGRFESVVTAEDPALREEISKQTLHTEELRKMPGTLGDPLRAIENLPGAAQIATVREFLLAGA